MSENSVQMTPRKKACDFVIPFSWEKRAPALLERCLFVPSHFTEHHSFSIDWDQIFEKKQPIVVEYCSGNGEWVGAMAKNNPHQNWIAVEKDFVRARKIWTRIFRMNLSNLFVVLGDALTFTQFYLPSHCISEVYINFPDPWPKRRHIKHRIIQPEFVEELSRVVQPGGFVTLVTDDISFSEWTVQKFVGWKNGFPPEGFTTEWPDFGSSFFYSLWKTLNRPIRFHRFHKP